MMPMWDAFCAPVSVRSTSKMQRQVADGAGGEGDGRGAGRGDGRGDGLGGGGEGGELCFVSSV